MANFFQANITNFLIQLKKEYGPIPGLFTPSPLEKNNYIFETFFLPRFEKIANSIHQSRERAKLDLEKCPSLVTCRSALVKGVQFCYIIKNIFVRQARNMRYLAERPDFHLGRFLSIFAERMFQFTGFYNNG